MTENPVEGLDKWNHGEINNKAVSSTTYLPVCGRIEGTGSHCKCATALCANGGHDCIFMFDTCPGTRACISL